jgi:hypothetical protein
MANNTNKKAKQVKEIRAWAVFFGNSISLSDITEKKNVAENFARLYGGWWEDEMKTKSPYSIKRIRIIVED